MKKMKIIKRPAKKTVGEHIFTLIKAAISEIPIPGAGAGAVLLEEYIGSSTKNAINKALKFLKDKLNLYGERIDISQSDPDEISDITKQYYQIILNNSHELKLKSASSILANAYLKADDSSKLTYVELDHMLKCINSLSIGSLEILGVIYSKIVPKSQRHHTNKNYRFNFEDLKRYFPQHESTFLMGLVGECNSLNLLHISGIPQIPTNEYGNYPIELTKFGQRFIKHMIDDI